MTYRLLDHRGLRSYLTNFVLASKVLPCAYYECALSSSLFGDTFSDKIDKETSVLCHTLGVGADSNWFLTCKPCYNRDSWTVRARRWLREGGSCLGTTAPLGRGRVRLQQWRSVTGYTHPQRSSCSLHMRLLQQCHNTQSLTHHYSIDDITTQISVPSYLWSVIKCNCLLK